MNKILKWILGIFPALGGILTAIVLGSKKNKKVKELDKQIKDVEKDIKKAKNKGGALNKTLESKRKALKDIEKSKFKKKDVSVKDASDFLKKYSKKKK
mgnify:CR=1 FL=1